MVSGLSGWVTLYPRAAATPGVPVRFESRLTSLIEDIEYVFVLPPLDADLCWKYEEGGPRLAFAVGGLGSNVPDSLVGVAPSGKPGWVVTGVWPYCDPGPVHSNGVAINPGEVVALIPAFPWRWPGTSSESMYAPAEARRTS